MSAAAEELSIAEWAVLGVVADGQTHGFAVARQFAPDGRLGRLWTLPRPLVYRAIAQLLEKDLIQREGKARGAGGPQRTLLRVTDAGAKAFDLWLDAPVAHIREARSHLIVKLQFLHEQGRTARPLVESQRHQLASMIDGLRQQIARSEGFDTVIAKWRLSAALALDDFLADFDLEEPMPVRRQERA